MQLSINPNLITVFKKLSLYYSISQQWSKNVSCKMDAEGLNQNATNTITFSSDKKCDLPSLGPFRVSVAI